MEQNWLAADARAATAATSFELLLWGTTTVLQLAAAVPAMSVAPATIR